MSPDGLAGVVERSSVVVCCGSGGVGKTTTAAVVALEAARQGRRSVVVTIDPARRLANALGLEGLSDTASTIPGTWDGEMHALMLDTKSTFDRLVTRNAPDAEQAARILDNRFYRNVSGALGGTQEYMAMEKLHELHDEGGFDLIVVDTPPTRHALDFLDAPERLLRLLDNRIFRLLMTPTRVSMRVASVAVQTFLHTVGRVVGSEVVDDVIEFLRAFDGMEEGFRTRAAAVGALLGDPGTAFVLVTAPRRDAVEEATFFAERLAEDGRGVAALIVNRVHPEFGTADPAGLRAAASTLRAGPAVAPAAQRLAAGYDNLADFRDVARLERAHLVGLRERSAEVVYVPYLAHDIHDFDALREIGALLDGRRA